MLPQSCFILVLLLATSAPAQPVTQASCPAAPADLDGSAGTRQLVVVSDHHMGLGRNATGQWDAKEDFRWSMAWRGFLNRVSLCGGDAVDLVVAGDLLELWQPPAGIACSGPSADLGCTQQELAGITRYVVGQHADDLRALGHFAARGSNRVVLIPGNHDAALMLDEPWQLLQATIGAPPGRVVRADDGIYRWDQGRVLVEHGHQIGSDVNRYDRWPLVTSQHEGQTYVVRPWGERFVQKLFNDQETQYPVIDNLSPEAAGARYRMADRGLWASARDVARFLAFNLFETSLAQAGQFLGEEGDVDAAPDLALGRRAGHRLFADALAGDDPFRAALQADDADGAALRAELDRLAGDPTRLSDAEVATLCALAEKRASDAANCRRPTLGATADKLLRRPKREIMAEHLRQRLGEPGLGAMRVFVYGHTHELETPWAVQATDLRRVTVLNSGAFQRVVDEPGFLDRAKARSFTPAEALRRLSVADLAACYTAVWAWTDGRLPQARTLRWHQPEDDVGRFVPVDDVVCR